MNPSNAFLSIRVDADASHCTALAYALDAQANDPDRPDDLQLAVKAGPDPGDSAFGIPEIREIMLLLGGPAAAAVVARAIWTFLKAHQQRASLDLARPDGTKVAIECASADDLAYVLSRVEHGSRGSLRLYKPLDSEQSSPEMQGGSLIAPPKTL